MAMAMKFEGGADLAKTLNGLSSRLSQKVQKDALLAGGEVMRQAVQELAPRRPGSPDLRDHILIGTPRRTSQEAATSTALVGLGVPKGFFYDWFNEFGTKHQGPHSFWRAGFDRTAEKVLTIIRTELWAGLIRGGFAGGRGRSSGGGLA